MTRNVPPLYHRCLDQSISWQKHWSLPGKECNRCVLSWPWVCSQSNVCDTRRTQINNVNLNSKTKHGKYFLFFKFVSFPTHHCTSVHRPYPATCLHFWLALCCLAFAAPVTFAELLRHFSTCSPQACFPFEKHGSDVVSLRRKATKKGNQSVPVLGCKKGYILYNI